MKKKGITWAALIGIILGVIVLLVLISTTYRLIFTEKSSICPNQVYWENIKENLKNLDKTKTTTVFFKNEGCSLVSFTLQELGTLSSQDKTIPEQAISIKQKPAICLCKIEDNTCLIKGNLNNCYFFNEIINFKIAGMPAQFNTGKGTEKDMAYLFIKMDKQDSDILINDYSQQLTPSVPEQLIGPAPGILFPSPVEEEKIA